VTGPRPHEVLSESDIPASLDWRNFSNVDYTSVLKNQHIGGYPVKYCGSCWAHGPTSSLSDRLRILRKAAFPDIDLSPQLLVNCDSGSSCEGGDPSSVYSYCADNGCVDTTCQVYQGHDLPCGELGVCYTCSPGKTSKTFWPGTCAKVEKFTKYMVGDYGSCSGEREMKAQLAMHGPISCGVQATDNFEKYTGGVYEEDVGPFPMINHEIAVVGYGTAEDGTDYWIGRNSWGTPWGENGWFRIKMGSNNLGIETDCSYGIPIVPDHLVPEEGLWSFPFTN